MNEVVSIVSSNPVAVLTDEKLYSEFYRAMKAEIASFVPDISTDKGRKEIASLAYKVTRSKTAIDAAGKKLNEESRAKINAVDEQRRKIRDELDTLAGEVRQPLTEWEDAEKAREAKVREFFDTWDTSSVPDSAEEIAEHLGAINALVLDPEIFQESLGNAIALKARRIDRLSDALKMVRQREEDARELVRLRAEAEERERAEREASEKAAREAAEKEAAARREAEEQARQERAEAEAQAREQRAADEARLAAERTAKAEQERIERDAASKVAQAEAEARAIREKSDREEAARAAEAKRVADEQAARDADRAHRSKVMAAAKEAMIELGASEDAAKKIVLAIIAGEIPNVSLRF